MKDVLVDKLGIEWYEFLRRILRKPNDATTTASTQLREFSFALNVFSLFVESSEKNDSPIKQKLIVRAAAEFPSRRPWRS